MILILGEGITGKSFIPYCDKEYVFFTDQRIQDIDFHMIEKVFVSPGFHTSHKIFSSIPRNIPIYNDFNIMENFIKDKYIIGVTGTKGKSTTTSMLYHALKNSGYNVCIGGNSNTPVLSLSHSADIYVLEVSSAQLLWMPVYAWNISIITQLSIDHLNYHTDLLEYHQTKMRIFNSTKYNTIRFARGLNMSTEIDNRNFVLEILNAAQFHISSDVLNNFIPLEHRLEEITYKDILIINDSCATNECAVIYGLQKYRHRKVIWLAGGLPKSDYQWIYNHPHEYKIIFGAIGHISCIEAIQQSAKLIADGVGDTIFFSPGCASFDEFSNAYERGKFFKQEILCALKKYI